MINNLENKDSALQQKLEAFLGYPNETRNLNAALLYIRIGEELASLLPPKSTDKHTAEPSDTDKEFISTLLDGTLSLFSNAKQTPVGSHLRKKNLERAKLAAKHYLREDVTLRLAPETAAETARLQQILADGGITSDAQTTNRDLSSEDFAALHWVFNGRQ